MDDRGFAAFLLTGFFVSFVPDYVAFVMNPSDPGQAD